MSLNDAAKAAAVKKVTLLDESFARFAVRATLISSGRGNT